MGEIKSAWEMAAARVEKLGGLSAEEKRQIKEDELAAAGIALADRFAGSGDERLLVERLKQTPETDRKAVGRALLVRLAETLDVNSAGPLDIMAKAAAILPRAQTAAMVLDRMRQVCEAYRLVEDGARGAFDREGREALHRLRISGTAVGDINVRARPEWREKLKELARPFAEQLEHLKKELAAL